MSNTPNGLPQWPARPETPWEGGQPRPPTPAQLQPQPPASSDPAYLPAGGRVPAGPQALTQTAPPSGPWPEPTGLPHPGSAPWAGEPSPYPSAPGSGPGAGQGVLHQGPLAPGALVRQRRAPPAGGLRRLLHRLTGGRLHLGPSGSEQTRAALVARARTPAESGRRRIAMVSLKGGVGKTTTTVMLGHTLATIRGDNVIAVDANPDAGNLASRIPRQTPASARDLLRFSEHLQRYADVRRFTSQAESRLEVLAGERDPALSEAFSAADYESVLAALERFYSIVLTDCGTGILHDAMRAVLWYADQLVVVTSPAIDSAQALGQLLDWLDQHGYHHLVASSVVAVNGVRPRSDVRLEQFGALFGARCRSVSFIPYDAALATGGEVGLEAIAPATATAYLELAAQVGDGFASPRLHGDDPRPAAQTPH